MFASNPSKRRQMILLVIITFNIISTWLHYTDNALFLSQYPGPEWFTSVGVISAVVVMTPVGLLGYWFYSKGIFWLAYLLLGLYSITSVSSPGHYFFPMVTPISWKMHSLIWLDGIMGVLLIGFLLWSSVVLKEWRSTSVGN
ncbi:MULTISPECIES: hypothetical protein [Nostoc]|uniref:Uncharacterized protein n=1 Tax=Nostoc paludosum FACHB-159 TaxID=2692908 RepID=A0ABR8KB69_9NOSO|nr:MULTISPECIES: hypothetical protein [Nostoc]MBD2680372.1 hypothetical protein [Nostoc sp. FACHB-857]MBD2736760.1 hypothetical protein [Nostoc paludosum FACHB-159]